MTQLVGGPVREGNAEYLRRIGSAADGLGCPLGKDERLPCSDGRLQHGAPLLEPDELKLALVQAGRGGRCGCGGGSGGGTCHCGIHAAVAPSTYGAIGAFAHLV